MHSLLCLGAQMGSWIDPEDVLDGVRRTKKRTNDPSLALIEFQPFNFGRERRFRS